MTTTHSSFLLGALAALCLSSTALAGSIGKIVSVDGEATILRGEEQADATLMMSILQNDTILTEEDSVVVIRFEDDSALTVGAESEVVIDSFVFDRKNQSSNNALMNIAKGFFQFSSGRMNKEAVEIRTPISTIGIRGTELFGEVRSTGLTRVALVQCCVDVTNEKGTSSLERVGTYTEVVAKGRPPSEPTLSPMKWVEKAAIALGTDISALGVEPDVEGTDALPSRSNRTSYPYLER